LHLRQLVDSINKWHRRKYKFSKGTGTWATCVWAPQIVKRLLPSNLHDVSFTTPFTSSFSYSPVTTARKFQCHSWK
jgi:hypothetical protein